MQNEERKTLKQQIAEGKALKLKEYQEKFESKNSTYILDEKAVKFYDKLKQQESQTERDTKQLVNYELRKFKKRTESKKTMDRIEKPKKTIKLKDSRSLSKSNDSIKNSLRNPKLSVVGDYSSDED